jgi:hypothetical protein
LTAALTLRATTPAELAAIDGWIVDCWLDAPLPAIAPDGELRLSIEQSPDEVDFQNIPDGLPGRRNYRETTWYDEWEQPMLAGTLTIRHVEEILDAPEYGLPLGSGIEFDQPSRMLEIDIDTLRLRVAALEVELEVMPEIVRWTRKRWWRIGPLRMETRAELTPPEAPPSPGATRP